MRRGHDSRLREVLDRLTASGEPAWVPPPGERDGNAFDDDGDDLDDGWLPPEIQRRDFTDALIADLSNDISHDLFEELASRGEDAEALLIEEDADPEMPVPLYSTRWVRVPDHVFEQYAPLAQRRPAP